MNKITHSNGDISWAFDMNGLCSVGVTAKNR